MRSIFPACTRQGRDQRVADFRGYWMPDIVNSLSTTTAPPSRAFCVAASYSDQESTCPVSVALPSSTNTVTWSESTKGLQNNSLSILSFIAESSLLVVTFGG